MLSSAFHSRASVWSLDTMTGEMEYAVNTPSGQAINNFEIGYNGAWVVSSIYPGIGQPFSISDSVLDGISLRLLSDLNASGHVLLSIRAFNPITRAEGPIVASQLLDAAAYPGNFQTTPVTYFNFSGTHIEPGQTYLIALTLGDDFKGALYVHAKAGGLLYYMTTPETVPVVPEPSTFLAGLSMLVFLGCSAQRLKNRPSQH